MTAPEGRFTAEAMTAAVRTLAERLNVRHGDARLLRLTNNAVFALPSERLVIRIARSHGLHDRVHKVAALGAWFADVNAPTIRLAADVPDQPVAIGNLLATLWAYVPPTDPAPTLTDLGTVLRHFHHLRQPPVRLTVWDPVADALTRINDAENLSDVDREFLLEWCNQLAPRITDLTQRVPLALVHGDAHVGNLLRDPHRGVILCDFDAACLGPPQVDLAAVAVGETRFGRHGDHARLTAAYGSDVTADPNWPLLREARELKMVAAATPLLASSPGYHQEFKIRLESIRRGDATAAWTPFAALTSKTPNAAE